MSSATASSSARRRTRALRYLAWGAAGMVMGVLLALLLVNLVARSERGQQWVLRRTLTVLAKGIPHGRLEINRLSGDLFRGAKVHGLALRDARGEPFVLADSAFLDYNLATLVTPRIVITRATLYRPRVFVTKLPGDSLWNYQEIFNDTTTRDTTRPRTERVVLLNRVRLVDASAQVQMEWRPDSALSPAARRRQVAEMLADTSPLLVRRVRGGYARTVNFTGLYGGMSGIQFAPGSELGSRFGIDSLRGTAQVYREPARIVALRGQLALMRDRIEFDAPLLRLPGSRLTTSGVVRTEGGDPAYDLAIRGDTVAFRDLRWLYPRFPREARGSLSLLIETRPEGMLFLARDLSVSAPGTRLAGDFGIILGDTVRFVNVDVEARPLRVSVIEQMLPEGLPVRGLTLGGVEIRGESAARRRPAAEEEEEPTEQAERGNQAEAEEAGRPET